MRKKEIANRVTLMDSVRFRALDAKRIHMFSMQRKEMGVEKSTEASLQLQLEEAMALSDGASQLQPEEASIASESSCTSFSSNSNTISSTTPPENDDPTQNGVGKRLRSGRILVPLPKRARRAGKRVVEGNEHAPFVKESCGICLEAKYPSEFFDKMVCSHRFCSTCIVLHIHSKLQENSVPIHCPEPNCSEHLIPLNFEVILPNHAIEKWNSALAEAEIPVSHRYYCPFNDCSALLFKDVPEVGSSTATAAVGFKKSECPECRRLFCGQCSVPWHEGLDCSELKKLSPSEKEKDDLILFKLAKEKEWQRCARCRQIVEKTSGCRHIVCRCGCEFCYVCGSEWKKDRAPCGCTG